MSTDTIVPTDIYDVTVEQELFSISAFALTWQWRDVSFLNGLSFRTDFASVPWPVRWFVGRTGLHQIPAAIHDAVYASSREPRAAMLYPPHGEATPANLTRAQGDLMFLECMAEVDVPVYQRYPMYLAVRAFGWIYWGQETWVKKLLKRIF